MNFKDICNLKNIDLHVHTKYSEDSFLNPKSIIRFAEKKNKIIAITDHNDIRGALEAKKYDRKNRIIIGEEILATDIKTEILAYNIRQKIEPGPALEVIQAIHDQGGAAVLAHPFRRGYFFTKKIPLYSEDIIQAIDGVETFNARNSHSENALALAFADKHNKVKTRGSDGHMRWELHLAEHNFILLNLMKNALTVLIKKLK